jgi:hypothetical protein
MKKLFYIFAFALFTGLIIGLVSCKSPDPDPVDPSGLPTLTVTVNPVVASPADATPGDIFNFHITAIRNASTAKDISKLEFNVDYSAALPVDHDSIFPQQATEKTTMTRDIDFTVPTTAHDGDHITITIKVTDIANAVKTVTWVFNVVIYNSIYTDSNIVIGSFANSLYGHFYSTSTKQVYSSAEAWTHQSIIDWCYFYSSDAGTIAAPNDTKAKTFYNDGTIGLGKWLNNNATLFREMTALTQAEFNALDATTIQSKYTTAPKPPLTRAIALSDGSSSMIQSFIAFKTANPVKYGVFRVDDIDQVHQPDGYINLTVKIQK